MRLTSRLAALGTVLALGCGAPSPAGDSDPAKESSAAGDASPVGDASPLGDPTPADEAADRCTQYDSHDCPTADERRALASKYRAELDVAKARWGGRGDYFFCQQSSDKACYTVSGGTLVGWYDPRDRRSDTEPSYDGGPSILYMGKKTMEGVFSQVEGHIDALEGKSTLLVDVLRVTYDPVLGYPMIIDASGGMESWHYTVYNFRLLEPRPADVSAQ